VAFEFIAVAIINKAGFITLFNAIKKYFPKGKISYSRKN
jgi:hypothetical protein